MVTMLKKEGEVVWREGNLICIRNNDKYKLDLLYGKKGILYNKNNSWLYETKFDYISEPEKLISIFKSNGTSRLINIPSGNYITPKSLYVKSRISGNEYLVKDIRKKGESIINISDYKR